MDQSGLAHSLTLSEPLRLRQIDARHFALRGTPTDCVIMGGAMYCRACLISSLSGVNSGAKHGRRCDLFGHGCRCDGGTLLGVRAIALSQEYEYAGDRRIVPWKRRKLMRLSLSGG